MRTAVFTLLLLASGVTDATEDQVTNGYRGNCTHVFSGSSYVFHPNNLTNSYSWSESRKLCKHTGYDLVSIESYEEWCFLNQTIQAFETEEYFIGLKKDISSGEWRWISNNNTVNASRNGAWPWATGEPTNFTMENCAQMYKKYGGFGRYNNIRCQGGVPLSGYICEGSTQSTFEKGSTHEPQTPVTASFKESITKATIPSTQTRVGTTFILQNRLTLNQTTQGSTREPQTTVATHFKESTTRVTKPSTQPRGATISTLQKQPASNQPTKGSTRESQTPVTTSFRKSTTKATKLSTQPRVVTTFTPQNRPTSNQPTQGSTREPQTTLTTRSKESTTRVRKPSTQPRGATISTLQNQPISDQSTQGTTFENTVRRSSWQNLSFGKVSLVRIIIVLLAVFILAAAVAFGILFCRRHQGHKKKYRLHDRVTYNYEVPPSSELQSIDPVHVQQTQSSTELPVLLTLSQTESEPATYEKESDCKNESEYYDMNETNGKSRSGSEGCSEIQEREREKAMMVGGKKGIEQPPTLCDEKKENKDNVYAIFHKERKSKVNSEASALKTSPGRSQNVASGLPLNKASGVDCTGRSSHQTDLGLDNIAKVAESETPQAGGSNEYLYAAVDMTTKKKKPPQMPPPYRGLVYADLAHIRENSAKLVQEQSQTVYAQIDHVKTASVKVSQQNLEETKEGEHK